MEHAARGGGEEQLRGLGQLQHGYIKLYAAVTLLTPRKHAAVTCTLNVTPCPAPRLRPQWNLYSPDFLIVF